MNVMSPIGSRSAPSVRRGMAEIAKASGIAASRIRRLNEAGYVSQSLDAPAAANRGDSDTALIDLVADPARTAEDELVASADTEVLRGIIAELPPGQRDAIEGRLAGKTLAEIGGRDIALGPVRPAIEIPLAPARQVEHGFTQGL